MYRVPANAAPALSRPPPLAGYAFYLLGAGSAALGIAEYGRSFAGSPFDLLAGHRAGALWGYPLGGLLVAAGLTVAWRATEGALRPLLAAASVLWLAMFALDARTLTTAGLWHEDARWEALNFVYGLPSTASATYVATFSGVALVFGLLAVVVHRGARAFAASTWAVTLGATLLVAHALEQAWYVRTYMTSGIDSSDVGMLGTFGFLTFAAGLVAHGRTILRGVTVDEYLRAGPLVAEAEDEPSATREALLHGLPLFIDAVVSIAALSLVLSLAMRQQGRAIFVEGAVMGGQIVATTLLVVALHRLRGLGLWPVRLAGAALAALAVELAFLHVGLEERWVAGQVITFVDAGRSLFAASAIGLGFRAIGKHAGSPDQTRALVRRGWFAALAVPSGAAWAWLGVQVDLRACQPLPYLHDVLRLVALFGLAQAIAAASAARRAEVRQAVARVSVPR